MSTLLMLQYYRLIIGAYARVFVCPLITFEFVFVIIYTL